MFEVLIYNGKVQLLKRIDTEDDILTCVWEFENTQLITQMVRDLRRQLNEMHRVLHAAFDPWEWVENVRNLERKWDEEKDH